MKEVDLYSFVYKGVLTEEALDRVGRRRRNHFGADEARDIQRSLSFDFLDPDLLAEAQRMAFVYAAIHAFENTVRELTVKAMAEAHGCKISLAQRTGRTRNKLLRFRRLVVDHRHQLERF
jgi:hypothetical protein